jgi:hypothetical protein
MDPTMTDEARRAERTAPTLADIIGRRLSRREALRGLGASLGTAALAASPAAALFGGTALASAGSTLAFKEIAHGPRPDHAVAEGYDANVVIRWGDGILAEAPRFDPLKQTATAQERQFGYNNDFVAFMPLPRGSASAEHGLLWVNHEYTELHMMQPGVDPKDAVATATREQADLELAAHGGSVVELRREGGRWSAIAQSALNRRITATTPIRISGPAAGHQRMRTSADRDGVQALGMLNNCSGGVTPWGTILTCEENFNQYFGGDPAKTPEAENHKRLGIAGKPNYAWSRHHDRFDVAKEPNEPNRFGWVVEIDPYDPAAQPVKRTALGRFKHEAATTALAPDGRVVVYSGDDERFEHLYRFVFAGRYDPANPAGARDLLDVGTLSVARFADDGSLTWLPLVHGLGPLTEANGFHSQADVLIKTRRAAKVVGATPLDRPEDVEPNPKTGRVYVVLTNNSSRAPDKVDRANPRAKNLYGHILELTPPEATGGKPDHGADRFAWDVFLLAGDPKRVGDGARYGGDISESGWLACPDNIAFDGEGRLWIASDQGKEQHDYGIGDGIWACDTSGPGRALTRFFYRVPTGAEMCGPCFTPDDRTLFVAVQHPAADDPGSTYEKPSTRWPDFSEAMPPRPAIVAITKRDGGKIGT